MFRFVFFWSICATIMMAAGVVPMPSTEDLPEFVQEIDLPDQPELLTDLSDMVAELPALGKRIDEAVRRPFRQEIQVAQLQDITQLSDVSAAPGTLLSVANLVNFDHNRAFLDADAKLKLDAFAEWLRTNPGTKVGIFGHTDLTGGEDYNYDLGQMRADHVAAYLKSRGIPEDRIGVILSFGEMSPVVQTEQRLRDNRRVEVELLNGS